MHVFDGNVLYEAVAIVCELLGFALCVYNYTAIYIGKSWKLIPFKGSNIQLHNIEYQFVYPDICAVNQDLH